MRRRGVSAGCQRTLPQQDELPQNDIDLEVHHLVRHGINTHTPYLARQLSTKDARQSIEGATHDGRLFGRGARDQELDGNRDTRHKIYIGSGRQCDIEPYVLALLVCIAEIRYWMWNTDQGTPAPPYILWRVRVTRKVS